MNLLKMHNPGTIGWWNTLKCEYKYNNNYKIR